MTQYITLIVALFAILNPFGNTAIFLGMVQDRTPKQRKQVALICAVACGIILLITTWIGMGLLNFFGISIGAFQMAGGIIVAMIGLSMMKGSSHKDDHHSKQELNTQVEQPRIGVIPLAMPIIAGPGAMTTLIVSMHSLDSITNKIVISIICCAMALMIFIFLRCSSLLEKVLGKAGLQIITRIMGLILTSIAVQMIATGVGQLFPALVQVIH